MFLYTDLITQEVVTRSRERGFLGLEGGGDDSPFHGFRLLHEAMYGVKTIQGFGTINGPP